MGTITSITPADEADCCCFCDDDATRAIHDQTLRVAPECRGCGEFEVGPAYIDEPPISPYSWEWAAIFTYNGGPYHPQCMLSVSAVVTCDPTLHKWLLVLSAGMTRAYTAGYPCQGYTCTWGPLTNAIPLHVDDDGMMRGKLKVHIPFAIVFPSDCADLCEEECVIDLTFNPDLGDYGDLHIVPPLLLLMTASPETKVAIEEGSQRLHLVPETARRYTAALTRWAKAGFPKRDRKERRRIYRADCGPCPERDGHRCKKCGCLVNTFFLSVFNKIAMATEHCPLKPPKW